MRDHPKVLGVIPAHLDSQRLPGKVLLNIGRKPMVHWVYERARQSTLLSGLFVATDSDAVQQYCTSRNIEVLMTGKHPSGSDRLHEVMERTDGDIYVNIQGDEPTIRPEHIELLLRPLLNGESEVTTLKVAIDEASARNPGNVKVVTDKHCRALYFSRFPIPFDRDGKAQIRYFKHIGLYGYTRAALSRFHSLPQSSLELAEKLEQLRYLENGISIYVAETMHNTIGVDTKEDLEKAAAFLATGD
ncbi:MAG: 3-deoxy-manno-octulosonate cytidylyltransferase [Acidobacteria bacterium]|nr:3-deoxy-manno-octulosonate cytidylyltransferase [Acidobacteriota bacterium]